MTDPAICLCSSFVIFVIVDCENNDIMGFQSPEGCRNTLHYNKSKPPVDIGPQYKTYKQVLLVGLLKRKLVLTEIVKLEKVCSEKLDKTDGKLIIIGCYNVCVYLFTYIFDDFQHVE